LIRQLIAFVLRIEFENVETVLNLNLAIQIDLVCDLILLFDQIQFLLDGWIFLPLVSSDLKQYFNHVLRPLLQVCSFVKDGPKLIKHGNRDSRIELLQMLSYLFAQAHGDLDTVIGGLVEQ
jgi:hypothetical protein